jgi:hypothetical protein
MECAVIQNVASEGISISLGNDLAFHMAALLPDRATHSVRNRTVKNLDSVTFDKCSVVRPRR